MTSMLGHALLSLLARRPGTGYDLTQRMRRPVGYFWAANHSQIYPELARLEEGGLVRHRVVAGAGPRPTKRYTITAAGRRALDGWLRSPIGDPPTRDEETLRVWSLWTLDPPSALAYLRDRRTQHAARLAEYEAIQAEVAAERAAHEPTQPLWSDHAALQGGILGRRAEVAWHDWMIDRLADAAPLARAGDTVDPPTG